MTLLSAVDRVEALLFQTGYLTVADDEQDEDAPLYRLDYPNHEVKRSLNALLRRRASRSRRRAGSCAA